MKKIFVLVILAFFCANSLKAQKRNATTFRLPKNALYAKGSVLVKINKDKRSMFEGTASPSGRIQGLNVKSIEPIMPVAAREKALSGRLSPPSVDISLYYNLTCDNSINIEEYINQLYATGYFEIVEPNYVYESHVVPNDPQTTAQYHLQLINAYSAWDIVKGSDNSAVAIAIIDSGGDLAHSDLKDNLYVNSKEIPNNKIDDDNNGYVDDVQGWDFIGADTANWVGDNNVQVLEGGDISHGSWTSGCASATTNNGIGIAGVAYNTKLLYTKHSADNQKTTSGAVYNAYAGILYAANLGIKIINCSFGGTSRSQIIQDIINHIVIDYGCLIVASAGNSGNTDPNYPAAYDNVISVAGTDSNDKVASFSNFGTSVDLSAPGVNIVSTGFSNVYNTVSGTSFSSPIVAGAAALVWAKNPTFTAQQVAEQLRVTADSTALYKANPNYVNLLGKGRLDIKRALTLSYPSVRTISSTLVNGRGVQLNAGEKGYLTLNFKNFLKSTNNLNVSISSTSNFVTVSKPTMSLGVLATGGTVTANPFELTLSAATPVNASIDILVTYTDGSYYDYQQLNFLVNRSFLDVNKNAITTTVSGIGRIGYEDTENGANGQGFVFRKNSMLYEMGLIMGTSSGNIFNNVRGINNTFDEDFTSIVKINESTQGLRSYDEIYGLFTDSPISGQEKISVSYRTLVWPQSPYDKFAILEYKVKNPTTTAINGFHFGIFADWDISPNGANDAAGYDANTRLGYVYPVVSDTLPRGGIQVLSGTPNNYSIDNLDSNAGSSSFGLYNATSGNFTDIEKFTSISSERLQAGIGNAKGNDVSHVVSSGPYSIDAGQEITIAFAVHAARTLSELKTSAIYADSVYNYILKNAISASACYGSSATITSNSASTIWYKNPFGGDPLATGSQFTTGKLLKDTVLYISTGKGTQTVRTPVTISVKANPIVSPSGATTFCNGQSVTLTAADADSYQWAINGVAGPTTKTIQASTSGSYTVTVKNTTLQCQTTSSPVTVTVNPNPVAKFSFPASFVLFTPATFTDQSTGAISWLWDFGDGLTSNLQNPTHTYNAISNPTVKLTVTSSNGCKNSVSNSISVITGVENQATEIVAYPNPINGQLLTLEIPAASKSSGVTLLNTFGQVMFDQAISPTLENEIIQIPVSVFPSGVYFIQVKTKDGLATKKILKN